MHEWTEKSFIGGHVVLDFLNTGGGDTKARDVDRFASFADVLTWAKAAQIIDADEFASLEHLAAKSPDDALRCLEDIREQRESLYRYLAAIANRHTVNQFDCEAVEGNCKTAYSRARLTPGAADAPRWRLLLDDVGLQLVKLRLDLAASMLMTGVDGSNIRQCETCTWLFVDPSSTKRRRWCSMALCGNRAKAQRHYYRNRETADE